MPNLDLTHTVRFLFLFLSSTWLDKWTTDPPIHRVHISIYSRVCPLLRHFHSISKSDSLKELKLRDRKRDSSGFRCGICCCLIYLFTFFPHIVSLVSISQNNAAIFIWVKYFAWHCSLLCTGPGTVSGCDRTEQNRTHPKRIKTKTEIKLQTSTQQRKINVSTICTWGLYTFLRTACTFLVIR